jgi:hypothetical protein
MLNATAKNEAYYRNARLNRVIVLTDLNYYWPRKHLKWLRELKAKGLPVNRIIEYFARDPDEVLLALIHLETCWKGRFEMPVITILEHFDFLWDRPELNELQYMWKKGYSVNYAAEYFERPAEEIILAIMHLAREDKIKRRKGGLF